MLLKKLPTTQKGTYTDRSIGSTDNLAEMTNSRNHHDMHITAEDAKDNLHSPATACENRSGFSSLVEHSTSTFHLDITKQYGQEIDDVNNIVHNITMKRLHIT